MAQSAGASSERLDKLKLIPQERRTFWRGVSFSLPGRAIARRGLGATKGDEAQPSMFFNRVSFMGLRRAMLSAHVILKKVIMARRVWASLARLDKLKLIPRGACFFNLPKGE